MAGARQSMPAHHALPAPSDQVQPSSKRSLPSGPCNYRDVASGSCGCSQFWDKCSAELHEGSKEHRLSSERSTWCVCGHHACFHLHEARAAAEKPHLSVAGTQACVPATCDGRCQLQPGTQCNIHNGVKVTDDDENQAALNRCLKASQVALSQNRLQLEASQADVAGQNNRLRGPPSQTSTSSLPRVPSVCLLSHDRRARAEVEATARTAGSDTGQTGQQVTGLGLSLINPTDRQQSLPSSIPEEVNQATHGFCSESEIPSTRANSVRSGHNQITSPLREPLDAVLDFSRVLHLDVTSDTIPDTYNPDEFIQSATEVATPSNANTPDLGAADQALHDTKKLVDTLTQLTSQAEHRNGPTTRPNSETSVPGAPLLLTNSPASPHEQIQQALRSGSPQALQKLVSYLGPLHNLLNSIPNVANTMRDLTTRLDLVENSSFNHVQPEDVQNQFELYEGRILDLEHRLDEHERFHQAIEADQSSTSLTRRRVCAVTESFGSNTSLQSTTSSALILAAIDRKEIETEVRSIKDRLDVLEAVSMPTMANPWKVEVVLLPWGPELRGIWFSPNESMHDPAKAITQDSEEWTQNLRLTRHTRSSLGPEQASSNGQISLTSSLALSESESGWSSQAISDWVSGPADELLSPKACGTNNLVYKRLQSRGFVRDVTLKSANSTDIQATLSDAFSDLLEHLKYSAKDDPSLESFPGLRASFIPLRKVIKESRLRFLTPAEMSSSALWSAHFLSSGVMMRVSGGRRRLYVTQREAYMQQSHDKEILAENQMQDQSVPWTWQRIRELPRFQSHMDSQMEGNEEHCQPQVAEADAKEACWGFYEPYDLPPLSTTSSFSSHHSAPVQLSMRPADRQWRRSITPSSILKNRQQQPISPLSEHHPARPGHGHSRTFSASAIEQTQQGSSKRRFNASPVKHSSIPHSASRNVSISVSRQKRRRVAPSGSPRSDAQPEEGEQQGQIVIWSNNTRGSREPPSPFFSSQPGLARTNSDIRSQRSTAIVGKSTPFAYATPYSGPLGGGGDFGRFADVAGDTEPDDADYEDDDGEKSWHGVDDEAHGSGRSSDVEGGVEEEDPGNFSGDDSDFDSEHEENESGEEGDDDYHFGAQRSNEEEEDDDDDVFDTLLGVLEH